MKAGIFRDALFVVAPCAVVLVGLASVDHRQRLVESGYRVASLEKERDELAREVEYRRARVANLSSPARLLGEAKERHLPVDYPLRWNVVAGAAEAATLVAPKSAPVRKGLAGRPRVASKDDVVRSGRRVARSRKPETEQTERLGRGTR